MGICGGGDIPKPVRVHMERASHVEKIVQGVVKKVRKSGPDDVLFTIAVSRSTTLEELDLIFKRIEIECPPGWSCEYLGNCEFSVEFSC